MTLIYQDKFDRFSLSWQNNRQNNTEEQATSLYSYIHGLFLALLPHYAVR